MQISPAHLHIRTSHIIKNQSTIINSSYSWLKNKSKMSQRIRIKLKSYDYNLVDKSAEKIVKTVKPTGAVVSGPLPLPTEKKIFTVLRSPHVNKKAREQFQLCSYKRLLDIYSSNSKTVDALMKLELPSGVEVEIKV
jgi:small subunit ribosomal protein S10